MLQKNKDAVMSLHNIVKNQSGFFIKKYSLVKNQFGKNVQMFLFLNCTGQSVLQIQMFSQKALYEFIKDVVNNQFIDVEKIIFPLTEDMVLYGGKNQVYVGFSKIINFIDFDKGILFLQKQGYVEYKNE